VGGEHVVHLVEVVVVDIHTSKYSVFLGKVKGYYRLLWIVKGGSNHVFNCCILVIQ
jgi:hypothetical protein